MSMVLAVEGFEGVLWVGVRRRKYYSTASTFFTTSFASGFLSGSAFCPLMSTTIGGFLSLCWRTPGRPQGSPPYIHSSPALTMTTEGVVSCINLRENQLRCQLDGGCRGLRVLNNCSPIRSYHLLLPLLHLPARSLEADECNRVYN